MLGGGGVVRSAHTIVDHKYDIKLGASRKLNADPGAINTREISNVTLGIPGLTRKIT